MDGLCENQAVATVWAYGGARGSDVSRKPTGVRVGRWQDLQCDWWSVNERWQISEISLTHTLFGLTDNLSCVLHATWQRHFMANFSIFTAVRNGSRLVLQSDVTADSRHRAFWAVMFQRKMDLNCIQTPSPYRAVNTLRLCYKNQSVNVV